jgi:hypothetical protein
MPAPCQWDIDPAEVCPAWSGYSTTAKEAALALAIDFLWAATGRQYGPCPVTVRPSQSRRGEVLYQDFPVGSVLGMASGPYLFDGRWFNAGCASACCGNNACAIVLRGPVAAVDEVMVGEDVIPPSAYRVDVSGGAYLLVRIDGECWPVCQRFDREPGEEGTFEVTYEVGRPLPASLIVAAGMLACEYGKFFTSGSCGLPARMTRLSRQGVEVEVAPPDPKAGTTGIKVVDDVIAMLNPSGRKSPPLVLSPDLPEACDRVTVVPAGS